VAGEWARVNGVTFDHHKSEAMLFSRQRKGPTATVEAGGREIEFNKEATRWLGIWLDSHLTLRDHQRVMMKKGRKAMTRLRRLTGQMGLTTANCRKVMTACVQSVAMYGSELWWQGQGEQGMRGPEDDMQNLVSQEARAVTGCFRTTNLGALMAESGLRPAAPQLENRQRRFAARLISLPQGSEAKKVVGATSRLGKRLGEALEYAGRVEPISLPGKSEKLGVQMIVEEREKAKEEAKKRRAGLTIFTDGSRIDSGAAGYAVVWKEGEEWAGVKAHIGFNQEAFDAECAALARALEVAAKRRLVPERVTVFTDAQAAIARIGSDEPGPGQQYALKAREWVGQLRTARPGIQIEIRWCPAHEGVAGNEKADREARRAAEEPDARGVEWMGYSHQYGRRLLPLPRSIANIKREIAEKKWKEAEAWSEKRIRKRKYRMPGHQSTAAARGPKRLAARFHQLRTGHCRTGQYLMWTKNSNTAACGWCQAKTQTRNHLFKECRRWKTQQKVLWEEVRKATGKGKNRFRIRDLLADGRCTRPILDFLHTTAVGSRVGPRAKPPEPGDEEAEGKDKQLESEMDDSGGEE